MDKIVELKKLLWILDSKHNASIPQTQENINFIADEIVKLFRQPAVISSLPFECQKMLVGRLSSQLNKQLEDYIIDGLKRKGFEFENRMELENFIKSNCRCEDRTDIKQRTYFVNDIPFFLHCYEIEMDLNPITTDREVKMYANYGRYAYL